MATTPRTWLPLTRAMVARRVPRPDFTLACAGPDGPLDVTFPAEWPGDPLAAFPTLLATLRPGQSVVPGTYAVVTRAGR